MILFQKISINCEKSIYTYLFYKKQQTDKNYHIKIEHSRLDSQYYNKVINSKFTKDEILIL